MDGDYRPDVEWALSKGFRIFPVHGVVRDLDLDRWVCTCRDAEACESPGKHPALAAWQRAASTEPSRFDWTNRNLGIVTDGYAVLDIDEDDALTTLELYESEWPETLVLGTGSGGTHFVWRGEVRNAVGIVDGADVRGRGGYIVGPGSRHESGRRYFVEIEREIGAAPEWLLKASRFKSRKDTWEDPLLAEEVAVGGRNDYLAKVAGIFRKRGASEAELLAILRLRNASVVKPPLDDAEVCAIARSVASYEPDRALIAESARSEKREDEVRKSILTLRDVLELPPPRYHIDLVWPEGGVNVLYGAPGTRKSFLALDWSLHRALGRTWHGYRVDTPAKVLYVAAEGVFGMGARVSAWLEHNGYTDPSQDEFRNFNVHKGALNLLHDVDRLLITKLIEEDGYTLLVFDTLRKSMTGGDENDVQSVGLMMSWLEWLSVEMMCDSLLIHHSNREGSYRGSSAIHGDAYNMWKMRRARGEYYVNGDKFKDAPELEWRLEWSEVGESLVVSGAERSDEDAGVEDIEPEWLEEAREMQRFLDDGGSQVQAAEHFGVSRGTVQNRLRRFDEWASQQH